jgi:putative aminopeptidase FrvX
MTRQTLNFQSRPLLPPRGYPAGDMMTAAMKPILRIALVLLVIAREDAFAQSLSELRDNVTSLARISAVTGHETSILAAISEELKKRGLSPQVDNMSNLTVTLGTGKPHRLLIANVDEPGFIVSAISADGYLRIQRIGTTKPFPYFDQYFEGQRLTIGTVSGSSIMGVLTIPSTHLARGADRVEHAFDLADAYIDVGAKSAAEVNALGIRVLAPISIEKTFTNLAQDQISGPFLSDRAGAAVLMSILTTTPASQIRGTVTFAFTAQEHFQRKGMERLTARFDPDEVYIIEPFNLSQSPDSTTSSVRHSVAIDAQAAPAVRKMLERFEGIRDTALREIPQTPAWKPGTPVIRLGLPVLFYSTPVEVLDLKNLQTAIRFLRTIVQFGVS